MTMADHAIQGLSDDERTAIEVALARTPTEAEGAVFLAMWNEHVSYKSSRAILATLPAPSGRVRVGPGENAGVVDLWDGLAVAFRIESHNHPSYIEPFQGAATGLGGILRDIVATGAWPIAFLDSLSFGSFDHPMTAHLLDGVVRGIAGYGNCVGVPTVGGETRFDATYDGNCLVNVACVGLVRQDRLFHGRAHSVGLHVIYLGAPTGRDGIQGAAMASASFEGDWDAKRSAVQVADPFAGRRLLEACHELMARDLIVGIQDMGAAGLTCSCVEVAHRSGLGMEVDLDCVPLTEAALMPAEILLSETQERMLLIVAPGGESTVTEVAKRWSLASAVIGRMTETSRIRLCHQGKWIADLPIALLTSGVPAPHRPASAPVLPPAVEQNVVLTTEQVRAAFFDMLDDPNARDKRPVFEQYDHMVQLRTVLRPGESDAAVLRVAEHSPRGLAMTLEGCACRIDPHVDAFNLVARAVLNLACVGARPLGLSDCLNVGNPERDTVMGAFEAVVAGLADASIAFNCPITGGNVSFYNESNGRSIDPTPVLLAVGEVTDVSRLGRSGFAADGDVIGLLGPDDGLFVKADPVIHRAVCDVLIRSIEAGLVCTAHDVAEGGLLGALAQCMNRSPAGLGACLDLSWTMGDPARALFGVSPSRVVVAARPEGREGITEMADRAGVHLRWLGTVVPDRFEACPYFVCRVSDLMARFRQPIG